MCGEQSSILSPQIIWQAFLETQVSGDAAEVAGKLQIGLGPVDLAKSRYLRRLRTRIDEAIGLVDRVPEHFTSIYLFAMIHHDSP